MSVGRAKLAITQGLSVWGLEARNGFGDARPHAHHAIQLTLALAGELYLEADGHRLRASAAAVAPDARHRFEARGMLAFLFVEPESPVGRALSSGLFANAPLASLDAAALDSALGRLSGTFTDGLSSAELLAAGYEALTSLVPGEPPPPLPDPRVRKIIDWASSHLDEPLSLSSSQHGVHLSSSRLRHLFVEQTGLAFKTYVLWLRLIRALEVYAEGQSLTHAAHAAGFADSAHLSRVFKRTFGLPATTLTRL
jgi:AraC family transcriptional regulator